jgi:ankyrin repeat protein
MRYRNAEAATVGGRSSEAKQLRVATGPTRFIRSILTKSIVPWSMAIGLAVLTCYSHENESTRQRSTSAQSHRTSLHYAELMDEAIRADDLESVKAIVLRNPKAVNAPDKEGYTPLHMVAAADNLRISLNSNATGAVQDKYASQMPAIGEFLLSHGANINARTNAGATPLIEAVLHEKKPLARALITRGADLNIADTDGRTALIEAALTGNLDLFSSLLSAGAKLDARMKDGSSPLHIAAEFGNASIVDYLIKRGVDVNSKDAEGRTPLRRANIQATLGRVHSDVIELLKQHGGVE